MNENTSSTFVVALLFVLRCLIPLGILFGISYLLRRWELVTANADESLMAEMEVPPAKAPEPPQDGAVKKTARKPAKRKTDGKKKSSPSRKKER